MANKYELYVCGHQCGCKTMKVFDANGDIEAMTIANTTIDEYEDQSGDYIYREYLYRNEQGKQIEICL